MNWPECQNKSKDTKSNGVMSVQAHLGFSKGICIYDDQTLLTVLFLPPPKPRVVCYCNIVKILQFALFVGKNVTLVYICHLKDLCRIFSTCCLPAYLIVN